jgi:hypothetical protein
MSAEMATAAVARDPDVAEAQQYIGQKLNLFGRSRRSMRLKIYRKCDQTVIQSGHSSARCTKAAK